MTARNLERWGGISQLLHWTIAVLILLIGVVGLVMGELPRSPRWFWVYTAHKSLGLTVLALVLVRIGWRLYAGAPPPVPGTPRWQARLASAVHVLLYAMVLAMPFSGWLYDSASGLRPLRWFGQVEVPKLVAPDPALADAAHGAHEWLFWLLVLLVLAHAGAALYHHFVRHDVTLVRMLPRQAPPPAEDTP